MGIIKGVLNITLKQNISVFQLKNEELYIYIGDVTIVTKVSKPKFLIKTLIKAE